MVAAMAIAVNVAAAAASQSFSFFSSHCVDVRLRMRHRRIVGVLPLSYGWQVGPSVDRWCDTGWFGSIRFTFLIWLGLLLIFYLLQATGRCS